MICRIIDGSFVRLGVVSSPDCSCCTVADAIKTSMKITHDFNFFCFQQYLLGVRSEEVVEEKEEDELVAETAGL